MTRGAAATLPICPVCDMPIKPGERRLAWFTKDAASETTERGAIHLRHVMPARFR